MEKPGGDYIRSLDGRAHGLCSHFVWANTGGKRSLCLDLKQDSAITALLELLAKCDVLVQNLAPGALARLGLPVQELRKRFPALIVACISGYGSHSSFSDKKAYDLLIQAESGLISATGTPEQPCKGEAGGGASQGWRWVESEP